MTAMLTAQDAAALLDIFVEAQEDHSLILYRNDGTGNYPARPAQDVQVSYAARQPQAPGMAGTAETLSGLTFYREPPFDVLVGDWFELDGHKGGQIRRVLPDPVLGVIAAEGDLDTGT